MAETTKRQSTGVKTPIATPNVGGAPGISMEQALSGAIGARIRVQTNLPAHPTLEGTLFTICPNANLLALFTPSPNTTHHVIRLSSLINFTLLSPAISTPAPLVPINTNALQARANAALARAHEKARKINKSVGREAQVIFDALERQFPETKWNGEDIVVMGIVTVKGPGYRGEDCRAGGKEGAGSLARVKKVLENERRRLAQREPGKSVKPVVPAIPAIPAFSGGPRKGG